MTASRFSSTRNIVIYRVFVVVVVFMLLRSGTLSWAESPVIWLSVYDSR